MKRFSVRRIFGAAAWLLLALTPAVRGQVVNGTIFGAVRDPSGGVIAGANITATSVETGAVRTAITDATGAYQVLSLPAGNYDVEAAVSGFKTSVRKGISVTVGASVPVNFDLAVGEVQQKVEVEATTPQLDTTNAAMGGLVGENAVRELPLNGRDWLQLATLQAGVTGAIGQQSSASFSNSRAARGNGESLSISGSRPTGNVFLVDGLVVNDYANASPGSGLNVNLGVEAIREFRVLTSEYSAEFGRSTGGVVTAVFKSGTNQFHGGVFEFLRNDILDARNTFDTFKPPFRRNQFGGSAGGPIVKNRTFVFGDYEELREVKGLAHQSFTLSPNARNGIICANSACTQTTLVKIAKDIQPYLAFFPIANGPVTGDIAQFNFAGTRIGYERYAMGRVDHNFTAKTTLSGSYQFDNTTEGQPDPYNQKITGSPSRHNNAVLALQHIFSPGLLNTARMGVSRTHATDSLDVSAIDPITTNNSLGFVPDRPAGIITVGGGLTGTQGGIGASGSDTLNYTSFQWSDDLSWIKGRNTFGFGGRVERMRYNKDSLSVPLGEFDFDTVESFLQGVPGQFTGDVPGTEDIRAIRQTYTGLYVDDAIALRPNLKVTLGLRYEYVNPLREQFGRTSNLAMLSSSIPVTGGPYFNTTTKNFSPRVAIAWDPTGSGKTSIRTGFGIYDLLPFAYLMENRTNGYPVFLQGSISPPPPSSFPTGAIDLVAVGSKRETYVQQNPPRAYNMQWNFSVQRQLASDIALTVGYVGSRGNHLPRSIEDIDQVPLSLVTVAPDGHIQFPIPPKGSKPQRINPTFSRIAATLWDDHSTYHALVTNLDKRFSHGLFLNAAYSWSKSIDLGSNTFSDNESTNTSGSSYAFIPNLQKGVSDFDVTHNFTLNSSWMIPTPASFTGAPRAILGGWEMGGIFTARSGAPFTVTIQTDRAGTGDSRVRSSSGGQRPDYNAAPGCSPNAINPGNPSNYIKTQCFSFPAPGSLGNLGRNTLRGPGLQELDYSLFKNWLLWHERMKLQFRAEAFNLLNKANYQAPKTKIFDGSGNIVANAAQLTSPTQTSEREIQFGLKLNW
ncbi:MAG TPA: TonB-dependent receptor [Bryobacteraceae bacterium]|nr:TonB-dependent receptor [Bryobacteraceae bacterium]